MLANRWLRGAALAAVLAVVVGGCGDDAGGVSISDPTTLPTLPPAPTRTPTAEPTPTPPPSGPGCDARAAEYEQLTAAVGEAMAEYDGDWGFAFIDLACELEVTVNPDYEQYSASAGKIVSIIATLRAVERGELTLEEVDSYMEGILTHSWDEMTDHIESLIDPGQLDAVVADSGVTESAMNGAWRFAEFRPLDLGRVWAALVRGDLLGEELTAYVLELAAGPDIPDGYETFPDRDFEHERLRYGQKAGYYVSDGVPYYFVGAGYLIDEVTGQAFVPVEFAYTNNPELLDPVRRRVFPLVVEHVEAVLGEG